MADELERMFRAADPARTQLSETLTPAQEALLDRIMREPVAAPRPRPALIVVPMAAVLVLILAVVALAFPMTPTHALTPKPIAFDSTDNITPEEVAAMAAERLRTHRGPALSAHTQTTGWYMQITELPEGQRSVAISPQVTTTTWRPDGSGSVRVVAGTAYWADGSTTDIAEDDAPPTGTELMSTDYGPGEMGVPPVHPTGETTEAMQELLTGMGMPDDADAADVMDFIDASMRWWTFTNAQHEALLRLVLEKDNVRILGTGRDRVGREVLGITAESATHPDIRTTLLVSAETGRIVGMESTRITADGEIPAGAVVGYTMWEVE